jgi:transposase
VLPPCQQRMLAGGTEDKEHAISQKLDTSPAVIGIDIGKNSFHIVGQNQRGAIVLRQKWTCGQVEARPTWRHAVLRHRREPDYY